MAAINDTLDGVFINPVEFAQSLPGGFLIYRAVGRGSILFANNKLIDIFGCHDYKEFIRLTGGTFEGMVYAPDRKAVLESIEKQVEAHSEKLDYVEYRIVRRDGKVRWVDDYGRLVHSQKQGDLFYVFISDTTEAHDEEFYLNERVMTLEALTREFEAVFLLSLNTGTMRVFRALGDYSRKCIGHGVPEEADGYDLDWRSACLKYARKIVVPEDAETYLDEMSLTRIKTRLESESSYSVKHRCKDDMTGVISENELYVSRVEGVDDSLVVIAHRFCRELENIT